jgi:hypothetical protein
MQKNFHLYQLVYSSLKGILYGIGVLDANDLLGYNFVALAEPSDELEHTWERTFWMLDNINALALGKGYKIALVVFPLEMQLNETTLQQYRESLGLKLADTALSGDPQVRLRSFAESRNIPIVDLLPVFRGEQAEKLYLRNKSISADPVHPSVYGHQVAGEEMYRVLGPLVETAAAE